MSINNTINSSSNNTAKSELLLTYYFTHFTESERPTRLTIYYCDTFCKFKRKITTNDILLLPSVIRDHYQDLIRRKYTTTTEP